DVLAMGGIVRKLWENENTITVAYMTSGNIAVFDHDVRRHLEYTERAAATLGVDPAAVRRVRAEVEKSLEGKAPGDVDLPAVQDLKRVIRESEAIAALEAVGLPRAAARCLDLPFYRTGGVGKRPIGEGDVAIVGRLLEETGPDTVFVAGDLSTPPGRRRRPMRALPRPEPTLPRRRRRRSLPREPPALSRPRRKSDARAARPSTESGRGGRVLARDVEHRQAPAAAVARRCRDR